MIDYNKRLTEVSEILKYLDEEDYNKIPKDFIELIENNKDKEYEWQYDETKSLKEQDVSRDTIVILSYINMEYLLNDEQKELMKKIYELNDEKRRQEEKTSDDKVGAEDLFENDIKQYNIEKEEIDETAPLVPKNNSFFKRLVNKLKKLFKIN